MAKRPGSRPRAAPETPVSLRAFARLLGLASDNAVRTAIKAQRLVKCLTKDGKIIPSVGREEWLANTDPRQQRRTTDATDTAAHALIRGHRSKRRGAQPGAQLRSAQEPPAAQSTAQEPAVRGRRPKPPKKPPPDEPGEDEAGPDGRTMADIRRSMLIMQEREMEFDWQTKLGMHVPKDPVLMFAMTLGREFRDATLRIADQYAQSIAADLDVDEHLCHSVLDKYLRKHFEEVIARISTDMVVTGVAEDEEADEA